MIQILQVITAMSFDITFDNIRISIYDLQWFEIELSQNLISAVEEKRHFVFVLEYKGKPTCYPGMLHASWSEFCRLFNITRLLPYLLFNLKSTQHKYVTKCRYVSEIFNLFVIFVCLFVPCSFYRRSTKI